MSGLELVDSHVSNAEGLTDLGRLEGYYKILFVDGGVALNNYRTFPAVQNLGLTYESLIEWDYGNTPLAGQNAVISGRPRDLNGHLLYPDGQPRFAMMYVNGGTSQEHGESLGEKGREAIRSYFGNGGSYTGSCAGALLASLRSTRPQPYWLGIWPGEQYYTNISASSTPFDVGQDSPLRLYRNFDGPILDVRHNGGGYAVENARFPEGTEVLARYGSYPAGTHVGKPSVWAYKASAQSGRLVVTGGHPEKVGSGPRLDLFEAMLLHALEGRGSPKLKGVLHDGVPRVMNRSTSDLDPDFTKIGDRQFHHYTIDVPAHTAEVIISVEGDELCDLDLFVRQGDFAFRGNSGIKSTSLGAREVVSIDSPAPGTWYVGVECTTTVQDDANNGMYQGALDVLNGSAYTVEARLVEKAPAAADPNAVTPDEPTTPEPEPATDVKPQDPPVEEGTKHAAAQLTSAEAFGRGCANGSAASWWTIVMFLVGRCARWRMPRRADGRPVYFG